MVEVEYHPTLRGFFRLTTAKTVALILTTKAAGRDQHGRSALVFCIQLEAIGGVLMLVLHVRELTGSLTTRTAAFITRCRG